VLNQSICWERGGKKKIAEDWSKYSIWLPPSVSLSSAENSTLKEKELLKGNDFWLAYAGED